MKEEQKPRTRWLLVIGIILFLSVFWWAPKLLRIVLGPTAPSSPDAPATNIDKERKAERHVEAEGGFSFIPPAGWEIRSLPGLKYKVLVGPTTVGFTANLNVKDEQYPGSLEDYVKASTESLTQKPQSDGLKVIKQENFTTAEGLPGTRLMLENRREGRALHQTIYFFGKGETKFLITGTTSVEGGDTLDAALEDSMKTFRFDDQKSDQ